MCVGLLQQKAIFCTLGYFSLIYPVHQIPSEVTLPLNVDIYYIAMH